MGNYYKQSIVKGIIVLCCPITHLSADLLNGPYSAKSQQLVKLIENPDMPLPEKFKIQEKEIAALREELQDPKNLKVTLGSPTFLALIKRNQIFIEATIQLIRHIHPTLQDLKINNVKTVEDYQTSMIAHLATQLNSTELYKLTIMNASQDIKNNSLRMHISSLFDPRLCLALDAKNSIRSILNNSPRSIKTVMAEEIASNIADITRGNNDLNTILMALDFLISLGCKVNFVLSPHRENNILVPGGNNSPRTLLDDLNNAINYLKKPTKNGSKVHLPYYEQAEYKKEKLPTLISIKKYIISKGAKTYAELTSAQKGQK